LVNCSESDADFLEELVPVVEARSYAGAIEVYTLAIITEKKLEFVG
jgi:hypothetical protein